MAKTTVQSNNQSGGITAGNVNIGGDGHNLGITGSSPAKEPRAKAFFWWVFGVAGFVAASIVVYQFFIR